MSIINVLLLCGGGGSEHDISIRSASFFIKQLEKIKNVRPYWLEICRDGVRRNLLGDSCELRKDGILVQKDEQVRLNFAIPCLHGYPGETGHIQALFELMDLPFFGCNSEQNILCFNKISTKLWATHLGIPVTPFLSLTNNDEQDLHKAQVFLKLHRDIYIKSSSQGSSIGCSHVTQEDQLKTAIDLGFRHSDQVLIEKTISGREIEIAVFEVDGAHIVSAPGEIVTGENKFYSYEEKYSKNSKATTKLDVSQDIGKKVTDLIQKYALHLFSNLKLTHLARIDFFLSDTGEVYLNEINTMPGHTEISMFPLLLEETGITYQQYLEKIINKEKRQ